ncbi:hypothetical protein [Ramlibacter sp. AN1133]|uniref:hypothetical protein n=1 Tax=Ramlibacter sp. AN1133 TaxID=3133429 RepID=UPI0030C56BCA
MPATLVALAAAAALNTAIVTTDRAVLRASPRDSAPQQAQLWQGEVLEVRGERLDFLQVWDPARERGGYVKATQVRRSALTAAEAPELLAVLRFLREAPGAESLGIAVAAAYLQAAPAETLRGADGAEALDALGTLADRLARSASEGAAAGRQATLTAHLEVAGRYGVKFASHEHDGRMRICYDGDAFRRVLTLPATPQQKANAALALTQPECIDPALQPLQRHELNAWRAEVLERVDTTGLPAHVKHRVALRRAAVWSTLAYERARLAETGSGAAAERALGELASVRPGELTDDDQAAYHDAAIRVNASRWAAVPAVPGVAAGTRPAVLTRPGQPGETCVLLVDAKHDAANPLARRCTYALVWPQSASVNREGTAVALAVQPMEGWRELWLLRQQGRQWAIDVLPPASLQPGAGYAEFAGWVPGGQQVLVAREARGEGKYRRSYEVVSLASLATQRQAGEPGALGPFQRWQDAEWKRMSVAVR